MKYKEIKTTDIIKYKELHPKYGRAWFAICPVYKRGIIREIFITSQAVDEHKGYHLIMPKDWKINIFSITSWTHKTEMPYIWLESWCKEHKALCHQVYVPKNTDHISFELHFGNTIDIRFSEDKYEIPLR